MWMVAAVQASANLAERFLVILYAQIQKGLFGLGDISESKQHVARAVAPSMYCALAHVGLCKHVFTRFGTCWHHRV